VNVPGTTAARRKPLGLQDYALLAEALATLVAASLAIRLLPFRRVAAFASRPPRRRSARDVDPARLRWAVRAWCRRVPWKALCFQGALALQMLLRRRGRASVLHYGIGREDGLKAHVWLSVDGEIVIGGDEVPRFVEVAAFPAAARA
jgi:hypothetical protein